jgi:PAS domain S-box-containing protein
VSLINIRASLGRTLWRYPLAVALLLAIVALRVEITPWVGRDSPLLVLLVPVITAALLFGYGSALLCALVAPVLATIYLHQDFDIRNPVGWVAHVALFEALALSTIVLIEQLVRSHQRLRENEGRLRLAMDASALGVFEWSSATQEVLLSNARMAEMLGLDSAVQPERVSGADLLAMIHEEDREKIAQCMSSSGLKHACSTHFRIQRDDDWRDIEISGSAIDAPGRTAFIGVARDLTQEIRERDRSALLESVVLSSGDAICSESLDGRITSWNPAAEALFGYSSAEAIGQPMSLVIPAELAEENASLLERAAESSSVSHPTERLHKSGAKLQVAVTVSAIHDAQGAISGFCRIIRDLSEQQRALRQLARSEQRFQQLADAMPQIVYVLDNHRNVHYLNRRWREYTGFSIADHETSQQVIPPEDLQRLYADWDENVPKLKPHTTEFRLRSKTGEFRWFMRRAAPILNEEGGVDMWIGTSTDIHEQKQIQKALAEADQRKNEFLAMLAHELRNPLAPALSIASLLERKATDTTAVQQMGGILKRQTSHLARLVDDLLDVSRITRGKINLKRERVILQNALERALEGIHPSLISKSQAIKLAVPQRPVAVEGDLVRLTQVFGNLLANASKFSPEGSTIHIALESKDGRAHLAIRDPGVGIDRQMLPRVFDLFMQADQSLDRSQGGLGIGLTIVKQLIELHGGEVAAHSEGVNRGSEFSVILPLAEGSSASPDQPAHRTRRKSILIVDDNVDAAMSLSMLLEFEGHEVRTAHDANSALRTLDEFNAEVAVLDIGLPGIDGYALAELIRQRPANIPRIIALSGYAPEESLREDKRFDAHLIKPVQMELLLTTIGTLSGQSVA